MTMETLIILGLVGVVIVAVIGKRILEKRKNNDDDNPDEIYPLF